MYTWGEGGGGLYLLLFNDLEKFCQYSDEKSAKLLSLNLNFLVGYFAITCIPERHI
jgi:hypothetical protein